MKDKIEGIYSILKKDTRLLNKEGELLKNKLQELVLKTDEELLKILLSNKLTKDMFFINVDNVYVFDKTKFIWVIDSKDFLPNSYTAFKNKIMLSEKNTGSIRNSDRVVLEFPYKDCLLEMDATEEKETRDEIFFNEIIMKSEIDTLLSPKVLTNIKRYSINGFKKETQITENDNLIIKGNNLLVLSSLIPIYKGKIKCMYWDILYNTDNDKVPYNDSFKHSSWLVMMKNRLDVAKKLLTSDGVMVIQCDKNEDAYLKVLMDEIFGRDNYINTISVKSSNLSGAKTSHKDKTILKTKDSILIYKNNGELQISPQYTRKEKWDTHYNHFLKKHDNGVYEDCKLKDVLVENNILNQKEIINEDLINNKKFMEFCLRNKDSIFRPVNSIDKKAKEDSLDNPNKIIKYYNKNGDELLALNGNRCSFLNSTVKEIDGKDALAQLLGDLWVDIDFQNTQNEGNNSLPAGKKPEALLKRIIEMFTNEGDIVLDSYLGSGTTAAVAHKINRRYIGIEQLDSHVNKALLRMKEVVKGEQSGISKTVNWAGGGEFVYLELAENSKKYIDEINKTNNDTTLNKLYYKIKDSEFIAYKVDINKMEESNVDFLKISANEKRKLLVNIIDKNTLYINYCDINDNSYGISDEVKQFNQNFYDKEHKKYGEK